MQLAPKEKNMKISPVVGTPTINQPSSTGLSPEKLQRLKMMASGKQQAAETTEEPVVIAQKEPASNKTIKMQTNKTPETIAAPQETAPAEVDGVESTQENAISDADVQTKPATEAIQQVSPQVAALAKQKRALQVKERELAEKEKALSAPGQSRAELEQKVKSGQALSVLQDLGITYDQLTNELLGNQNAPDFTNVKEEILKTVDERLAGKDAAQEEAVFSYMQRNVDKLSGSDQYPFVKADGAQDKVMDLIRRAWKEDGEVMDEEEALALIEEQLKEKYKGFAKLLKEPEQTTQAAAETSPKQPGIKTLTNKDSARPPMNRRQRALAAALGQK